jgi:multidrug efflux pump subunit AcrB
MSSFSAWAARHKRSLLFLLSVLAAVGAFATFALPASLFPAVDFPRVVVSLDAGDQPAEQMEALVTRPIEQAIRRVPGVTNVRSTTSRGSAEVSVSFDWGIDMASATLQVNAATAQVMRSLPSAIRDQVTAISATTADDVTLTLGGTNSQVVWGSADQSALKAKVLETTMRSRPPASVSEYDVSSPAAIVVR